MKLRIAIPLTMIVSFALTCGISIWVGTARDHASSDHSPPSRETNGLAQQDRLPPVEPLSSAPAARISAAPISAIQVATETPVDPVAAEPTAKTELPVQFNYRRSPGDRQTYVLTLINKIEKSMTLDMTIFNPTSGHAAEAQITLEPTQAKKIGVDDSLEIQMGDRITLHNPSYNDLVAEIRQR